MKMFYFGPWDRAGHYLLKALDISVEWELAPSIKARIKQDAEALLLALLDFTSLASAPKETP